MNVQLGGVGVLLDAQLAVEGAHDGRHVLLRGGRHRHARLARLARLVVLVCLQLSFSALKEGGGREAGMVKVD